MGKKSPYRPTTRAGRAAFKGTRPIGGYRAQSGAMSNPVYEQATILLHQLSDVSDEKAREILVKLHKARLRIPEGADEGVEELVAFCRAKLMQILIYPTRHAASQVQIIRMFMEEACGKVPDKVQADQNVKVEIVKNAPAAAAPPAPATGSGTASLPSLPSPLPTHSSEE